jgi:uncharacterized protein with PIN domain
MTLCRSCGKLLTSVENSSLARFEGKRMMCKFAICDSCLASFWVWLEEEKEG